jgi:hypothetical protein
VELRSSLDSIENDTAMKSRISRTKTAMSHSGTREIWAPYGLNGVRKGQFGSQESDDYANDAEFKKMKALFEDIAAASAASLGDSRVTIRFV